MRHRDEPDYAVSRAIIATMRELGWAPPTVVTAMVAAAGGKIEISTVDLTEDHTLLTYRDHSMISLVLEAD
jgi:hypothetical protein